MKRFNLVIALAVFTIIAIGSLFLPDAPQITVSDCEINCDEYQQRLGGYLVATADEIETELLNHLTFETRVSGISDEQITILSEEGFWLTGHTVAQCEINDCLYLFSIQDIMDWHSSETNNSPHPTRLKNDIYDEVVSLAQEAEAGFIYAQQLGYRQLIEYMDINPEHFYISIDTVEGSISIDDWETRQILTSNEGICGSELAQCRFEISFAQLGAWRNSIISNDQ